MTFAEITERGVYEGVGVGSVEDLDGCPGWRQGRLTRLLSDVRAVDRDTLGPILFLLENSDIEVQRAASAALGNLAVNSTLPSPETRHLRCR